MKNREENGQNQAKKDDNIDILELMQNIEKQE